jgi:MFS family permease
VSFIVFGGIFGAFIAGSIAEKIGRKLTIIISIAIINLSNLVLVLGSNIDLLCLMRITYGFGCGLNMMIG